jgi:hypothetical protein
MNTVIVIAVVLAALGAMYWLYKSVEKNNRKPLVKPPKEGNPVGEEPKELP